MADLSPEQRQYFIDNFGKLTPERQKLATERFGITPPAKPMPQATQTPPTSAPAWKISMTDPAEPPSGIPLLEPRGAQAVESRTVEEYRTSEPTPAKERSTAQSTGRLLLELGTPLAMALMTRNPAALQSVWQRAAQLGLTTALGTFLGSLGSESFDPSTDPVRGATRKGLEAGGAAFGGRVIPYAGPEASRLARTGYGALRALTTGGGAGTGSLVAEPVDPSSDPLSRALRVGETTAGVQAGGSALGSVLPIARGRALTPLGREAAETMREANVVIPSSVSESKVYGAAEHQAERSLFGGRALESAWRQARNRLTTMAGSVMDQIRGGRTQAQIQQTTGAMYDALDTLSEAALTRPTRPVFLTGVQDAAHAALPFLGRGAQSSPTYARLQALITSLASQPEQLPYGTMAAMTRHLDTAVADATRAGIPGPTLEALRTVVAQMRARLGATEVVDLRGLQPVFQDLRTLATRYPPDSAERALLSSVGGTDAFVTPEAARAIRSDLLEIGRKIPAEGLRLGPHKGTLRHIAANVEREVDQSLARAYTGMGADVNGAWREANAARRFQAQVARLGTLVEGATDEVTHTMNGQTLLKKLADPEEVRALGDLAPDHVEQLRRLAQAMAFHQQQSGTGLSGYVGGTLPRLEGHIYRALGPFQVAAGGLLATGHPILGFLSALTPEVTGYLLSRPMVTRYLTLGLQMDPTSPHYAALARQLVSVLAQEGFTTPKPRERAGTPPAPASP